MNTMDDEKVLGKIQEDKKANLDQAQALLLARVVLVIGAIQLR